jgi:uncharacterized membrane protein
MAYKGITDISGRRMSLAATLARSATGTYADLAALTLLYMLTLIVVHSPYSSPEIVRIGLALIATMFLPGYAFIAAVFPARGDISGIIRVLLSVAFSIVLVSFLGFLLDKTIWGINLNTIVISVTLLTAVCMLAAFGRRRVLPADRRLEPGFINPLKDAKQLLFPMSGSQTDRLLSFLMICAILIAASSVALAFYGPKQSEKFTELYISGPGGKIEDYPAVLPANETKTVIVGIANHEGIDMVYDLVVRFEGQPPYDLYTEQIPVMDNQTISRKVDIKLDRLYEEARVTFSLYKDAGRVTPYRQCYLLLDATAPPGSTPVEANGTFNTTLTMAKFMSVE